MAWVSSVGDLWRSSDDIRKSWESILANAHLTDTWAPNARPGRYNDADELEIGNGHLTLSEQRSHFALVSVQQLFPTLPFAVLPRCRPRCCSLPFVSLTEPFDSDRSGV